MNYSIYRLARRHPRLLEKRILRWLRGFQNSRRHFFVFWMVVMLSLKKLHDHYFYEVKISLYLDFLKLYTTRTYIYVCIRLILCLNRINSTRIIYPSGYIVSLRSFVVRLWKLSTFALTTAYERSQNMARVYGPASSLKDGIQQRLSLPFSVRGEGKVKKSKAPETFKAKRTPRQMMESRGIEEYNSSDLFLVFSDEWKQNYNGRPVAWTMKDRKQMKLLIEDQGAETVVRYIKYAFSAWGEICRRYRINGYPCVSVLFGYRRSLVPECLNGVAAPSWGAEYTGA